MEKLENITKELQNKVEFCKQQMEESVKLTLYSQAAKWKARMEAYQQAIVIVNTLF